MSDPRDIIAKVLLGHHTTLPDWRNELQAQIIIDALAAAGYRIELDPDFLLQKGRDAGVVLK